MNHLITFYISLLIMTVLWLIAMIVPNRDNIYFLVQLPKKNSSADELAVRYRTRALDAALLIFIFICVGEALLPSMLFVTGGASLWLLIFVLLYYDYSLKIIKIKRSMINSLPKPNIKEPDKLYLKLLTRHGLLQVFLLLIQFYFTFSQIKKSTDALPNTVFVFPLTTLIFLGLSGFAALRIGRSPRLAAGGIENRAFQMVYITSLWVSLLFLSLQWILLFGGTPAVITFLLIVPGLYCYGSLLLLFQSR